MPSSDSRRMNDDLIFMQDLLNAPVVRQETAALTRLNFSAPPAPFLQELTNWNILNPSPYCFGNTTESTPQEPSPTPWPIGTILRLKNNLIDFPLMCEQREIRQSYPLAKVMAYSSGGKISKLIWIGHVEKVDENFGLKYFQEANPFEIAHYEQAYRKLNTCQTKPNIGVVVQYLGKEKDLRNKQLLVIGHWRNNEIECEWMNDSGIYDNMAKLPWSTVKICDNQDKSFVPDVTKYCHCQSCGSMREISTTQIIRESFLIYTFCDTICARNNGYDRCACCALWSLSSLFLATSDGGICTICHANRYISCMECERVVNLTHQNDGTCISCQENRNKIIHDYLYKPTLRFNKMAWENTRYLGVELEVEHKIILKENFAKLIKEYLKINRLDKLVYFKNDGSLSNGIEIVFHPFTLKSFHKNFPMKEFLDKIIMLGGDISSGKCGMHVHVSKEKLTNEQLIKGKWFFYKCAEFLKRYSGRKSFAYCYFEENPNSDPYAQKYGRHTAFNVAGSTNTVELRLFNSTLEYKKFLSNLQFADVFVDYIQHGCGISFLKLSSSHIIWQNFIDYMKKDGKYQVLSNYILQNAIV